MGYKELKIKLKNKNISQRQFITLSKIHYKEEVNKETSFLNQYNDITFDERLYYVINDLHKLELCPYCNNKKKFTGRINLGYRSTCGSKECESKNYRKLHIYTNISSNRNQQFINWQNNIKEINDDIIIKRFFTNKGRYKRDYTKLISNPKLINYLNIRFNDSESLEESIRRIKLKIEEKPKCPTCGKPVKFIGKPNKMFTTYCSTSCSNKNKEVINKKQDSDKKKHNGYLGWVLSNSNSDKIEKRKNTMLKHWNSLNIYNVPEIREKIENTNIERYGYKNWLQNPENNQTHWEKVRTNGYIRVSKSELLLKEYLESLYPDILWHYYDDRYGYINSKGYHKRYECDFYIPSKDLFIEFQGSYFHHFHEYNSNNIEDIKELENLKYKSKIKKLENLKENSKKGRENQYDEVIYQWTKLDPKKREIAKKNNINYLEIWNLNEDIKSEIEKFPNINKN